jgi:predicted nucleic acid-binding protein
MGRLIMILVDTTVVIDIWHGKQQISTLLKRYKEENYFISAITITELYDGLGYTKEKKGKVVYKKIEEQIEKVLSGFHIIPLNIPILQESGALKGSLRAKGILLDIADCIIGVTAKLMNAEKIITRNARHFQEFGVNIETYDIT